MTDKKIEALFVDTAEVENDAREVIRTFRKGDVETLSEASFNFWASQGKCVEKPKNYKAPQPAEDEQGDAAGSGAAAKATNVKDSSDENDAATKPAASGGGAGAKPDARAGGGRKRG